MMKLSVIQASLDAERSVATVASFARRPPHLVQPVHLGGCARISACANGVRSRSSRNGRLSTKLGRSNTGRDLSDPPGVDHVDLTPGAHKDTHTAAALD